MIWRERPGPGSGATSRRPLYSAPARMLRQFIDVRRARAALTAPRSLPLLAIDTTVECNARCGMCGYPTDYPAHESPLSSAELCAIVDEAAALGTLVISLGGGEAFLRDDTEAVIRHIDAHGITSLVHSNGSLLTPERCARLAANERLALVLSLDSNRRAVHDRMRGLACFDRAVSAARHFTHHAPQVRVGFTLTVTRENYRDMLATMRLACDLGVRTMRFTPFHENLQHRFRNPAELSSFSVPPEERPALLDEIERVIAFAGANRMITNSARFLRAMPEHFAGRVEHRCFAGFLYAHVDPFGNVFPCYDHQGGVNVRTAGGLTRALQSPQMTALRRQVDGCTHRCWNVGTAEPSLRMDPGALAGQLPQLVRETLFFLR